MIPVPPIRATRDRGLALQPIAATSIIIIVIIGIAANKDVVHEAVVMEMVIVIVIVPIPGLPIATAAIPSLPIFMTAIPRSPIAIVGKAAIAPT